MADSLWIEGVDATGVVVVVERATAKTIATLGAVSPHTIAAAKLMASAPEQQAKIDLLGDALEDCLGWQGMMPLETRQAAEAALRAIGRIP